MKKDKDTREDLSKYSIHDKDVREMILKIIDDAMKKRDRYVSINFFQDGPYMTVFPLGSDGEEDDSE